MTEGEQGALGCTGLIGAAVLIWAVVQVGGIMRDPQGYRERHVAAAAQAEAEADANEEKAADKAATELAANEARYAEADRRAAAKRDKENSCIREFDYETCRRIYNPTAEELEAQIAISQRANRIAEAYSDR